jgi:arylsulfatase A-like enzyme
LPLTETTIANHLQAAGYKTGLVGKWHLGGQEAMQPQRRGFAEFFGFLGGAHGYFQSAGILRGTVPADEKEYLTDALAREAAAFIERHQADPWLLCLTFNAVHTPMQADDVRLARFAQISDKNRRTYAAMMFAMDEAIGRVRKQVADLGLSQDTLVCFISDNGGPTMPGTTVNASRNAPLRGSKRTTLEGGIRVPFVVAWPGRIKPGVFSSPAIQLDLTATALAAAQVAAPPTARLDGVNLLPYLSGEQSAPPHDALYWRFGNQMAIRMGDYKLVRYDVNADTLTGAGNQGVTTARLYNLRDDIGETSDLAAEQPEKVRELQSKWDAWDSANVKPLWGGGQAAGGGGKKGAAKSAMATQAAAEKSK